MYSDSLTHVTEDGRWFGTRFDASLERLLKELRPENTRKAVLAEVPVPGNREYILSVSRRHPDRFLPLAFTCPSNLPSPEEAQEALVGLQKEGFRGLKLHPRMGGFSLDSPWTGEVLKAAAQVDMPVFLCTAVGHPSRPLKRPLHDVLFELCQENQETTLVLVHGGFWDILAVSELIRPFPRAYLDLSTTLIRFGQTHLRGTLQHVCRTLDRRILLGSDFPEYGVQETMDFFMDLVGHDLPAEKLSNITGGNLLKVMNGRE